jgi:hypothetical protein
MVVCDVVEEEASLPAKEGAVDGSSGTTLEVPLLTAVVGQHGVGVMEVGDHDNCVKDQHECRDFHDRNTYTNGRPRAMETSST